MRIALTLLTVGAILGLWWLMYRSWQRRAARTSGNADLPQWRGQSPSRVEISHATYLGTVTDVHWLDRIASHGLGGRNTASVVVTADQVGIFRNGQLEPIVINGDSIREVVLARGFAGRTYGKDSVIVTSWEWGEQVVHTGLRISSEAGRRELVGTIRSLARYDSAETGVR